VISVHLLTINLVQTLFAVTNWFWQTEDARSPMLIIAPDVLVAENWINEILKFTKGLVIYNCTKSDVCLSFVNCPTGLITHRTSLQKIRTVLFSKLYTVVVTTYSQLQTNTNNSKLYLKHKWGLLVLDECHKIWNQGIQYYKAANSLVAKYRLGLSGMNWYSASAKFFTLANILISPVNYRILLASKLHLRWRLTTFHWQKTLSPAINLL
jgi:SNF2 family DNA or RNA helicase